MSSEIVGLTHRAENGDDWAVDRLLSRPAIPDDAAPYWAAFLLLSRDRPNQSISMGMGGGLILPRPISRDTIRREGRRLGYSGDALDDFTEILTGIDDKYVEITVRKAAADAKASADKSRKK